MKRIALLLCFLGTNLFAELPDAPSTVVDSTFVSFTSVNFTAALADAYISHRYVQARYGCEEFNPLLSPHPSARKMYLATLLPAAGVTVVSFMLKKHRRSWKYPFIIETGVHFVGIGMTFANCSIQ